MANSTPLFTPTVRSLAFSAMTLLACGSALAQWQWLDSTGRKVFSDTPPPAGTPEKSILKTPGPRATATPAPTAVTATATAQTNAAAAPKPSGRDEQLEAKKKQADEAEQSKKRVEADKMAKARADNCDRAKRAKATLDSGIRIATTNAKGEREILDDKARAAEAQRMNETIRSDCGALPLTDQ